MLAYFLIIGCGDGMKSQIRRLALMEKSKRAKNGKSPLGGPERKSHLTRFNDATPGYYVIMVISGTETGVSQYLKLVDSI